MTTSRRAVFVLAACALLFLPIAGCGSSSDGKVTLTYLLHYISQPGDGTEGAVAQQFEKAHPNVHIDIEDVQPGTEFAKFETMTTGGSAPDVYLSDDINMASLIGHRVLAPVDYSALGVKDKAALMNGYLPRAFTEYSSGDQLYGVPAELSNYGAWMNVDEFKKAGIAPPKTWDEVCADGQRMQKMANGKIVQQEIALPTSPPDNQVPVLETIAQEFGGPVFNEKGTASYLSSKPVIDAMSMLQKLVYVCHAASPSLNGSTPAADRLDFSSGQAAILLTGGAWYLGTLQQGKSQVAPPVSAPSGYPSAGGGSTQSISYGYAWVVPRSSEHQQLAWQFVKALTDAGVQTFKQTGVYNGTQSVANSTVAASTPFWSKVWKPLLATAHPDISLVNSSQVNVVIGNAMNAILLNHEDVTKTMTSAQAKVQSLMNHG